MASPKEAKEKDARIASVPVGSGAGSSPLVGSDSALAENRVSRTPTHEEIAVIAYEIYIQRGGGDGNSVADWLEAERRLAQAAEAVPDYTPVSGSKSNLP